MGKPGVMISFPIANAHMQDVARDIVAEMDAESLTEAILSVAITIAY